MKIGKNEKRALALLLKPTKIEPYNYPEDGKSIRILAEDIYPNKQVKEKGIGRMGINNLLNSVVVSLLNTLNSLHRKELVIKSKPIYKIVWEPKDDDIHFAHSGYMSKYLIGLKNVRDNSEIEVPRFKVLPDKTKIWWILTDKGRELAEELISKNPELDELSGFYYKNKMEKQRRKLIKRCIMCLTFNYEEMYCKEEEMQGIEYETENCKYHNLID